MNLVIKGGRVIDPLSGLDQVMTVVIRDGRIAELTRKRSVPSQGDVIDARGAIVAPGFIDIHTHLRDPGFEYKEDIASGSRAAVAGGFTLICCMPNTNPINDCAAVTEYIVNRAREVGLVRVLPIGAISHDEKGERLADIGDMAAKGIPAISDDGRPVVSGSLMRRAMEYARAFGLTVISHAEDLSLSGSGVMHEGEVSTALGLKGIPAASEEAMVARDIMLAKLTGARLHIAHLSSQGSVELVREAKRRGIKVTAEVTPHHLLLTDQVVAHFDPNTKVNPPLRSDLDRLALVRGLVDGTIDAIATDHAPHNIVDKEVGFDRASFGMIGLETALPVCLKLVHEKKLTLKRMIEAFTLGPARVLGLQHKGVLKRGGDADLTIFDPKQIQTIDPSSFRSKSCNTPFAGWRLNGQVRTTIVGGRIVFARTGQHE